jgi:hypothetical protein
LEDKVEVLHQKFKQSKGDTKIVNSTTEEKRQLQVKHEKVCSELKIMKNDLVELKKCNNAEIVALKSAKKGIRDLTYKYEKKLDAMNDKIQELSEFRNRKFAEEKDLKSKIKKADKRLKQVEEKESKLNLKLVEIEKKQTRNHENGKLDGNRNVEKEKTAKESVESRKEDKADEEPSCQKNCSLPKDRTSKHESFTVSMMQSSTSTSTPLNGLSLDLNPLPNNLPEARLHIVNAHRLCFVAVTWKLHYTTIFSRSLANVILRFRQSC